MTDGPQPLFPLPRSGQSDPRSETLPQHSSYPQIGASGYPTIGLPPTGASAPADLPPSASPGSPRRVTSQQITIVAALAAVAALVVVIALAFNRSEDKPSASESSHDTGQSSSGASVKGVTACSKPPELEAQSTDLSSGGLTLNTVITPSCSDGDLLSNNRFQIAVSDDAGHDVASGMFDLSANPIAVGSDGTSVHFVFPAGTYWRTADTISGNLSVTASGHGTDATVSWEHSTTTVIALGVGTPTSGNLEAAAHSALVDIVAADAPFIDAHLLNAWQPQLSSKRPGLFADGMTWTDPDIVREHMQLRERYPGARLVWAGDWPVYSTPDWWITLSGIPFSSGAAANDWCSAQGFDGDHCFAKIISHTMGTSGTTMLR